MRTADFDYHLPPECIAQTPVEPRDSARLLVMRRSSGELEHRKFHQVGEYLKPGDLVVLNQTRVIPARLFAYKPSGGRVEILLLRYEDANTWECLVGGKGLRKGIRLEIESNGPEAEIIEELESSRRRVKFSPPIDLYLKRIGQMPLPPYIHEPLRNPERYQTVYSREPGSAAAPTAGLHFTERLLDEIREQGVRLAYITLHVGLDTFAPVKEKDPAEHKIHTEWCEIGEAAASAINETRQAGGRVVAVGTTTVRTLESAARYSTRNGGTEILKPYSGNTDLFITPGYQFRVVDSMITNFHLPRSTLIMLVSAFAGGEAVLRSYEVAKVEGYRFYSFGDAMLIL